MRLKVTQEFPNSAWGMECNIETPENLPSRLLSMGKGTFTVTLNDDGELVLSLHN